MTNEAKTGPGGLYRTPSPSELFTPVQIELAQTRKEILLGTNLSSRYIKLKEGFPATFGDPKHVDRQRLFASSLGIMEGIAHEYGAELPSDLLSRLVLADLDTLVDTLLPFLPPEAIVSELKSPTMPFGFVLPGNIAVVNVWRINREGYDLDERDEREKRDDHIREEGIHQLWRLAAWKEGTAKRQEEYGNFVFRSPRDGIFVQNDAEPDASYGMFYIDNETQNYLTRRALKKGNYKTRKSYKLFSDTVDNLVGHVGEEPLVQAFLNQDGLSYLQASLDRSPSIGGEHVLWYLAQNIGKPTQVNGHSH